VTITFGVAKAAPEADVLGVPVFAGEQRAPGSGLDAAFLAKRSFEGKPGETVVMPGDNGSTLIAVGMGERRKVDADAIRRGAACLVRAAWRNRTVATTLLDAAPEGLDRARAAQAIAEGASLAAYRFTRYKNDPKACEIEAVTVVGNGGARVQGGLDRGAAVAAAVVRARDLVNEPSAAVTPVSLAKLAEQIAAEAGLAVDIIDEKRAAKEGLGGLAGVGQGSTNPPRLIRLEYVPDGARATVAIVGKGITFDSGGLSLKPADSMETMKCDMSGAAAVLQTMSLMPVLKPKVRVLAYAAAAENMPDGRAIRPGDVLTIRNGKTVEVLNTDAEGRLVLADALSLAVEAGADAIIDLATLTGACMIALGKKVAGLMGNNDGLVDQVRDAAERAGEAVWHLPLPEIYRKDIDSDVADIKNTAGRYGGTLTAGLFLREFVGDVPWAHLDIAGPAFVDGDDGYIAKGGTGIGVRTLAELLTTFKKPRRGA
jgi:leucyl aminopeptidase